MDSGIIPVACNRNPRVEIVPWRVLWDLGREMMSRHCQEFGIPSLDGYLREETRREILGVETHGNLVIAVGWDPEPIGYIIWIIELHHGLGAPAAKMGPWYVEPEYRGTGLSRRMYALSLRSIRYRGVRWALTTLPRKPRRHRPTPWGIEFETTYLRDLFPKGSV